LPVHGFNILLLISGATLDYCGWTPFISGHPPNSAFAPFCVSKGHSPSVGDWKLCFAQKHHPPYSQS
jgi:hypothetical protein